MKKFCTIILPILILLGIFSSSGQSATISLNPTVDTYIRYGSGTPQGSSIILEVGQISGWDLRTLMQFDLAGIPDDATITSAQLSLYAQNNYNVGGPRAVRVGGMNVAVTNSMTANTHGSYVNFDFTNWWGELSDIASTGWKTWNLLQTGNWNYSVDLLDDTLDLYLKHTDESGNVTDHTQFRSTEWDSSPVNPPVLVIEYVPIPGAVWLLGSGLIGIVGIRRKFKK